MQPKCIQLAPHMHTQQPWNIADFAYHLYYNARFPLVTVIYMPSRPQQRPDAEMSEYREKDYRKV